MLAKEQPILSSLGKRTIYLRDSKIDCFSFHELKRYVFNPIFLTIVSKKYFGKMYPYATREIRKAIRYGFEVIHIRNTKEKIYDVSTPYCGKVKLSGLEDLAYQMYAVIGIINTYPILYKDENEDIIRAVAPRQASMNEASSQSPYNDLDWHVDAAYRPIEQERDLSPMPDYLIFGVVHKGHENLPITYICLKDILAQLTNKDILTGLSSEFSVSSPDSFGTKMVAKKIPMLVNSRLGVLYNRINLQHTKPLSRAAAEFLRKVREIVEKKEIQNIINVKPGDIVVLNNKTTLHKRSSYKPLWDGMDRYFLRIYSVRDLNQGITSCATKPWEWL